MTEAKKGVVLTGKQCLLGTQPQMRRLSWGSPRPPGKYEKMKFMNYGKNEIKLRLNDEELAELKRRVGMTGMSREQYFRTVLKGMRPVQTPPLDYYNMVSEIRRVGYNMR